MHGWFNLGKALDGKGWSAAEFARRLKVRPQAVSRYFAPGFDPNVSTVVEWCEVLECSLEDLFDSRLKKMQIPRPVTARHYSRGWTRPRGV